MRPVGPLRLGEVAEGAEGYRGARRGVVRADVPSMGAFFGDALADVRARDGVLPGGWGHGGKARPVCESWLELTKAPLRFFVFKKISEASSPRRATRRSPVSSPRWHSSLASIRCGRRRARGPGDARTRVGVFSRPVRDASERRLVLPPPPSPITESQNSQAEI